MNDTTPKTTRTASSFFSDFSEEDQLTILELAHTALREGAASDLDLSPDIETDLSNKISEFFNEAV